MTSLRSSRSLSNLQVNSLRFNQQDLPAGGGILAVGSTGEAIITSAITLASIDVSDLSATTVTVSGLTAASITVSSLAATVADISGLTSAFIAVTDVSADSITVSSLAAATIDVSGLSVPNILVSGITATAIDVVDLSASTINAVDVSAITITTTGLTAGTATFTGDITAQDIYVYGQIQALDVSARYFDISGLKASEDVDVSGALRVDLSSTFVGPATFLNTMDASGQSAIFGSVTIQNDLSAATVFVTTGATVQGGLSTDTFVVSGGATFDSVVMDTLTVRDIYIQNQIVDVSLGQITQLLIDDILAGSNGATTHSFAAGYPLDVSGGIRIGDFGGTYLRITPGATGWSTLEPVGAPGAGVAIAGDLSASIITASGVSATGITATNAYITNGITADSVTATGIVASGLTVSNAYVTNGITADSVIATSGISTAGSIYATGNITTIGSLYAYDVSARYLDISGLRTNENVDVSGTLTVEQGSLLKGGVTMQSTLDVSGSINGRSGLRVVTPASQTSGVATGTTIAAGYIDTNVLRIFVDGGGTGATLGQLQLPIGSGGRPNGAALVWNNAGLDGGNGDAQLVIGTGGNTATGGKFNVYTGITQQAVPIGLQPQMSLDGSGNLTIVGQLQANTVASVGSITGNSASITNQLSAGSITTNTFTLTANGVSTQGLGLNAVIQNSPNFNQLLVGTNLGASNYNSIVQGGDIGILFRQSGSDNGNLVIAPHGSMHGGVRISSAGTLGIHGDVTVTANSAYTKSANIDVNIQNATSRNQLWIGTDLTASSYSPLVSDDDTAILFNQTGIDTGSLVIGQWSSVARGIRISNSGLVYIGQNVEVPGGITAGGNVVVGGNLTVNGSITGNIAYSVQTL